MDTLQIKRKYTRKIKPKTETEPKPKRKYTRKIKPEVVEKETKPSPAATVPTKFVVESVKPKRKYTRKIKHEVVVEKDRQSPTVSSKSEKDWSADFIENIKTSIENISNMMYPSSKSKDLKPKYVQLMDDLAYIMRKRKDMMRARAYTHAKETIDVFPNEITSPEQLKGKPGIGTTIYQKLVDYTEKGTLKLLDENVNELKTKRSMDIFTNIFGIGEKKAEELVEKGVTTLEELKERQLELLNDKQQIGLKYYDDILERIPREEIVEYEKIFESSAPPDVKLEIVGSYRRGMKTSGDIDVILTSEEPSHFKTFIDALKTRGILVEILSCGNAKCLVIARINSQRKARRVDFLYTNPKEYPFAVLYFTGSKGFNTSMREYALGKKFSLNEHGLSKMNGNKKGELVDHEFPDEASIFSFLELEYVDPKQRTDGRMVKSLRTGTEGTLIQLTPENIKPTSTVPSTVPIPTKKRITIKKTKPMIQEDEPIVEASKPKKTIVETILNTILPKTSPVPFPVSKSMDMDVVSVAERRITTHIQKDDSAKRGVQRNMKHIQNFQKEGINVLDSLNEQELTSMLHMANQAFHNDETPIMTDGEYDILHEYIEERYPKNQELKEIGAAPIEKNKATLPYEMASMDKIVPEKNALSKWVSKYKGPYVISSKLDGVSGLYTSEGDEPHLYTRGDGKIGQDITYLIPYLKLPKERNVVIRGEFVIKKSVFLSKYAKMYANPRNLVAGIVNAKTLDKRIYDVDFVAYEVIKPENMVPSQQMKWLESHNVLPVKNQTLTEITNENLSDILQNGRRDEPYDMDGIIVSDDKVYSRSSGNPAHSFAFKMVVLNQLADTHVVDVIWAASKNGYLKPRVRVQPVSLGGVSISYATGFNADFIEKNKIGIGALIQIKRAGDVIPIINSIIKPAEHPKMPSVPYVWNKTHVDVMLENASEDVSVRKKQISAFFKTLEVEGMGEGNVSKLVDAGFDTMCKIVHMTEADFLSVDGFQKKMAEKLAKGIRSAIQKTPLPILMAASGKFGRGMGTRKIEAIFEAYPNVLAPEQRNIALLTNIKGMSRESSEEFVKNIPEFLAFMEECDISSELVVEGLRPSDQNSQADVSESTKASSIILSEKSKELTNKTLVFSGFRNKELETALKTMGTKIGTSISSNTFALIVPIQTEKSTGQETEGLQQLTSMAANPPGKSGKMKEAEKYNVPIYSLDEFTTKYQIIL